MVSPIFPGAFDITILRAFGSTAQQDDYLITEATKVHSVTGAEVDTKFIHTAPN
jgi:hypothetical protein